MSDFFTVTRYYGKNDDDLKQLWRFIDQAQTYSKRILIAVNTEKDLTDCITQHAQRPSSSHDSVDFLPIQPWIGIATPLNILLNSVPADERFLLIQSIEIQCTPAHLHRLRSYLHDENVLCVGAALDGHQTPSDTSDRIDLPLRGDTSPWNTFILWNCEKLRRTGFPMCSDLVSPAGMEDSAAIALQQKLFGGKQKNRALLVQFPTDLHWLTRFENDQERSLQHQTKMKSKNHRTEQQLNMLNISAADRAALIGVEYVRGSSSHWASLRLRWMNTFLSFDKIDDEVYCTKRALLAIIESTEPLWRAGNEDDDT